MAEQQPEGGDRSRRQPRWWLRAAFAALSMIGLALHQWGVGLFYKLLPAHERVLDVFGSASKTTSGSSSIETGSIKGVPQPQDLYTKCLEEYSAQLVRARRRVDVARTELAKCISDYRSSRLFATQAAAQVHCGESAKLLAAHEASAKSVEASVCRKPR